VVPSRRLVLCALAPAVLALVALLDQTLLWPMLALDASLVVLAAADAVVGRRRLIEVTREAGEVFSIGRQNPVTLELRSLARRRLAVAVRDDLFDDAECEDLPLAATLPARGRMTLRYRVKPSRRGSYLLGDHHVRYPTPLGLWQRQLRIPAEDRVKVYPDVAAVRTYELLARQDREYALVRAARLRGGESEFERLREYLKDDEFRSIDWKATARRQKLIAREYQLERNQNLVFLLDCGRMMTAETGNLSHLDHALNAILMMSHVAARSGDHVGLLAFDDEVRSYLPPGGGAKASQRIIQASYDLHPALVESDYARAFDQLAIRVRKRALVILFTQIVDDVAARLVTRLMRSLLPRHLPLVVLFRDTDLDQLAEPTAAVAPGVAELDLYLRGAAAEMVVWRDRLVRDFKAGGALVLDVPPHKLTPALINRYLEIKARQLL
jgi:uncharacterized protein (DUF58 family)